VTKGAGVTVAVVDTGVSPHPDLRRNLLKGTEVLPDRNGNGQIDENGHGTSMAGLIAAHGRNRNDGALGIAPDAKILPVRDQEPGNNGGSTAIAAGIRWAATHGSDVINVSAATGPSLALKSAVETAAQKGAVVVAGSGNLPRDSRFGYPAAMPGVLAVGAIDRSGKHAAFSVTGEPIQICAPGVDIESTRLDGRYYIAWGTSSATAIVSGAAALVRAKYPDLSAPEVIHRLTATATDIGKPGRDNECGYGVLNVVKALTADVPPLAAGDPPPTSASPTATTSAGSTGNGTAAPEHAPRGNNAPLIVGGAVGVVAVLAGLLLFAARRRKAGPDRPAPTAGDSAEQSQ
jgi:type VII secretion-associated serine protease mycosin